MSLVQPKSWFYLCPFPVGERKPVSVWRIRDSWSQKIQLRSRQSEVKHKRFSWTIASIQKKVKSKSNIVKLLDSWLEIYFFVKEIESQKGEWENLSHILEFCMFR